MVAWVLLGCACGGSGSEQPEPLTPPPPTLAGGATPAVATSPFTVTPEGELTTPKEVSFRVRELSGPGSMGPAELAPESDAALRHVQEYLDAHPDGSIRVECSINVYKTSSGPNARYAANLAGLVARWLVDHGVACRRLEAVGRLERARDAPTEKIRFLVRSDSEEPDAREDPCPSR